MSPVVTRPVFPPLQVLAAVPVTYSAGVEAAEDYEEPEDRRGRTTNHWRERAVAVMASTRTLAPRCARQIRYR